MSSRWVCLLPLWLSWVVRLVLLLLLLSYQYFLKLLLGCIMQAATLNLSTYRRSALRWRRPSRIARWRSPRVDSLSSSCCWRRSSTACRLAVGDLGRELRPYIHAISLVMRHCASEMQIAKEEGLQLTPMMSLVRNDTNSFRHTCNQTARERSREERKKESYVVNYIIIAMQLRRFMT